ncbi:unnamed protein product [Protopolystoma xenopodis]|uniref:Uncharacterized protein n=1 Tax=Protopolystoma xenopodis TaxID=117903 RepID=A0A3S5B6T7_9PLAT|nr:unnamed protein product [Protopolystoma xenopodis]
METVSPTNTTSTCCELTFECQRFRPPPFGAFAADLLDTGLVRPRSSHGPTSSGPQHRRPAHATTIAGRRRIDPRGGLPKLSLRQYHNMGGFRLFDPFVGVARANSWQPTEQK